MNWDLNQANEMRVIYVQERLNEMQKKEEHERKRENNGICMRGIIWTFIEYFKTLGGVLRKICGFNLAPRSLQDKHEMTSAIKIQNSQTVNKSRRLVIFSYKR